MRECEIVTIHREASMGEGGREGEEGIEHPPWAQFFTCQLISFSPQSHEIGLIVPITQVRTLRL